MQPGEASLSWGCVSLTRFLWLGVDGSVKGRRGLCTPDSLLEGNWNLGLPLYSPGKYCYLPKNMMLLDFWRCWYIKETAEPYLDCNGLINLQKFFRLQGFTVLKIMSMGTVHVQLNWQANVRSVSASDYGNLREGWSWTCAFIRSSTIAYRFATTKDEWFTWASKSVMLMELLKGLKNYKTRSLLVYGSERGRRGLSTPASFLEENWDLSGSLIPSAVWVSRRI